MAPSSPRFLRRRGSLSWAPALPSQRMLHAHGSSALPLLGENSMPSQDTSRHAALESALACKHSTELFFPAVSGDYSLVPSPELSTATLTSFSSTW
eukprot:5754055-Amphidinium_carterae.2